MLMPERLEVYKCGVCGNIVEVVHSGQGTLVCCGQDMVRQRENTVDASVEKHVPLVESTAEGIKVSVGSVPHPMDEKHYIEWVELMDEGQASRQFLQPGNAPAACFGAAGPRVTARAYCNLHGLWKSA
jgi:superoxide reductase